jgi:hypothetical protein
VTGLRALRWYAGSLGLAALACIALVIGVALADKVSARPLASRAAPAWQPPKTKLVMLDEYPVRPAVLSASRQTCVGSQRLGGSGNRQARQLAKGTRSTPASSTVHSRQAVLLTPAEFAARLCSPGCRRGVDLGEAVGRAEWLGWLQEQPVFRRRREGTRWWRVRAGCAQETLWRNAQQRLRTKVSTAIATRIPASSRS